MKNSCMNKMRMYSRTIAGDQEILAIGKYRGKEITQAEKYILRLTIDEKTTLNKIIQGTEFVLDILEKKNPADAIKVIKENKDIPEHMTDYLNLDILPLLEKAMNQN